MAACSMFLMLFMFSTCVGFSSSAVYKVGGKMGWTTQGSPNYTAWAAKETFHVGDTLLFMYNKMYHNVIEVNKSGYDACTTMPGIATYATGNDSITIKTATDYYFLCGFPTHCKIGQKVKISVAQESGGTSSSRPRKGFGLLMFALLIVAAAATIN